MYERYPANSFQSKVGQRHWLQGHVKRSDVRVRSRSEITQFVEDSRLVRERGKMPAITRDGVMSNL